MKLRLKTILLLLFLSSACQKKETATTEAFVPEGYWEEYDKEEGEYIRNFYFSTEDLKVYYFHKDSVENTISDDVGFYHWDIFNKKLRSPMLSTARIEYSFAGDSTFNIMMYGNTVSEIIKSKHPSFN